MYRPERQPAWQKNLVWGTAILLLLTTMFSVAVWPLARLASEKHGPTLLHHVVTHVLPQHGGAIAVQAAADFTPGEPLALVAGADITFTPAELAQLTTQSAIETGAALLTSTLFTSGAEAALALVERANIHAPIERALAGPMPALLASTLGEDLFAAGIAASNRLADWRAQQAANPGANVQPLVGVFIEVPPAELEGLSTADIGAVVVRELTNVLVANGQDAAREALSNPQHVAAFDAAIPRAHQRALDLFTVLLYASETEVEERLSAARAALSGNAETLATGGFVSERELAQLPQSEQYQLITKRIADAVYANGAEHTAAQLSEPADQHALTAAAPLFALFSEDAHSRYARLQLLAWITGLLLIVVLALNARGYWRFVLPALLIGLGVLSHVFVLNALVALPHSVVWKALAVSAVQEGMRYALYIGAGLLALQLIIWVLQLVRPRRRRRYL